MTTNSSLQANFIPSPYIPVAGTYNGLFYENDEVQRHTSGYFTIRVTPRGTYSGRLQTAMSRYSFRGVLGLDCRDTNFVSRKFYDPLRLELNFGSGDDIDQVAGSAGDTNWTATLIGDRAVFDKRYNPSPYAGNYTLVLPGQAGDPFLPAGDGYGTVRVTTAGQTTFTGWLGDGTRVIQRTTVSKNGQWPLHSALRYRAARGALLGWMSFANRPNDDLYGRLSWIKPPILVDRFYQLGLNTELEAVGSIFTKPVNGQTDYVLNLTAANVEFSGGNLISDFSNSIQFGPSSRISNLSANQLKLSFSTKLGTFTGSVMDPATLKTFKIRGAVLQKQNAGFGLLIGTNQTSRVLIK